MDVLLFMLGSVLLLLALVDALWTTLALEGAGPVAGRVAGALWNGFRWLHRRLGNHRVLTAAAPVILVGIVVVWTAMLWGGWVLLFSADPASIVHETTREPASLLNRFYFIGYTFVTLGVGDYVPQEAWQLATVFCSLHGLFELTIGLSYLLPVLGVATSGRQIASRISALGDTPTAILTNAWTGRDFGTLNDHLAGLSDALALHSNAHKAYPVLHYFHSTNPISSPPLRLAVLDEALTLLEHVVRPEARLTPPTRRAVRAASTQYLRLLETVYIESADEAPPPPGLGPLREVGIPVDEAALREGLAACEERRRLLLGMVRHDGWTWEDVVTGAAASRPSAQHAK